MVLLKMYHTLGWAATDVDVQKLKIRYLIWVLADHAMVVQCTIYS